MLQEAVVCYKKQKCSIILVREFNGLFVTICCSIVTFVIVVKVTYRRRFFQK